MPRPTKDEEVASAALAVAGFIQDNLDVLEVRARQLTGDRQSLIEVRTARRRLEQLESYIAEMHQRAIWRNDKSKKRKPKGAKE